MLRRALTHRRRSAVSGVPPGLLLTFALVVVLAASPSRAQEAPAAAAEEPGSGVFFETVDVDVVNVEVYVTDKDGNPVPGLPREAFEVREDGRPVEVTNFYAVANGRPAEAATAPSAATAAAAPQAVVAPAPGEPALPEDQRLSLVVYLDDFNLEPANRAWVIEVLRRYLHRQVGRGDRAMLISYDHQLHVRQPFTDDYELLDHALDEIGMLTAGGAARAADRHRALSDIDRARGYNEALSIARERARVIRQETGETLRGAKDLVEALGGVPGRKALLYVCDGLPMVAADDLFTAVAERFGNVSTLLESQRYDLRPRYQELAALANTSGVTLYTLDARGLDTDSSVSAAEPGMSSERGRFSVEAQRNMNLQAPLQELAQATGGIALLNTNALDKGLARLSSDLSTYYSLGYRSVHHADGRYHTIDVRVDRPGVVVRHREGYRGRSLDARMTQATVAALNFGSASNPLDARLDVERTVRQGDGLYEVDLLVRIPIARLTLVPQDGVYRGRVRLWLGVMDGKGDLSPVLEQKPLDLAVPAADLDQARGAYYTYELPLRTRPGPQRLAVALVDELSATSAVVLHGFHVGG